MLKIIIRIALIAAIAALAVVVVLKLNHKKKVAEQIALLPGFAFPLVPSGNIATDNLPAKTTFVIFFNPGCGHCEYEGRELSRAQEAFKEATVLMVSTAPRDSIIDYRHRYGFDTIPHFYTAIDSTYMSLPLFDVKSIPTVFIYDTERRLRKTFFGEVKIEALLSYIP